MSAEQNEPRVDDWVTLLAEELEDRSGMMAEDIEHQIRAFAPGPVAAPAPSAGFPSSVYVKSAGESGDLLFAVRGADDPGAVEYRRAAGPVEFTPESVEAARVASQWKAWPEVLAELRLAHSASASVSDGEPRFDALASLIQREHEEAEKLVAHLRGQGATTSNSTSCAGATGTRNALAHLLAYADSLPSAGDVERNVEAAVRCCRLAGLRVTPGSRPLPSGVDAGDAERDAGEGETALENALAHACVRLRQIRRSDKTPDYHYPGDGPHTANRLGEEAPEGERWSTPHELATVALDGIHAVVPWWSDPAPSDVQEDENGADRG